MLKYRRILPLHSVRSTRLKGSHIDFESKAKIVRKLASPGGAKMLGDRGERFMFSRAQENGFPEAFLRFAMVYFKGHNYLWIKSCNGGSCTTLSTAEKPFCQIIFFVQQKRGMAMALGIYHSTNSRTTTRLRVIYRVTFTVLEKDNPAVILLNILRAIQ